MPIGKSVGRFKSRIVKVVKGSAFNEYYKEKNRRYFQMKQGGKKNEK